MSTLWEIVGWAATVLLVGAYALVATHRLDARSSLYHVLNVVGAIGLVSYSIYKMAWPQVALNAFWGAVGVIGIIMAIRAASRLKTGSGASSLAPDDTGVREG